MRRLFALRVAFLTLFGRPGAGEALENLVHAAAEGHAAHSEHSETSEADDHGPMHLEHGCGGGAHVCVCHAPTFATESTSLPPAPSASETRVLEPHAADRPVASGFSAGVYRPPAS